MQDFQSIPGLTGRIFTGSDAATTHRLRNYPSSSSAASSTQQQHQQQLQSPIKCPRCDSTNTKFCYYNNYNLSQPRHFCKSCRRYWTKGGVLRNVPVGGGCRKNSKRSSKSSKPDKDRRKPATAPSGSSSESSSTLTASHPNPDPNPNPKPNPEPNPDPILEQSVFPDTAGSFTSLMAGTADGFNFSDPGLLPPGFRVADPEPAVEQKAEQAMDPNPNLHLQGFQAQGKGGGLNGLYWGVGGSVNSGSLFDITSSVDPAVYWNQSHWGDTDPSLYLP